MDIFWQMIYATLVSLLVLIPEDNGENNCGDNGDDNGDGSDVEDPDPFDGLIDKTGRPWIRRRHYGDWAIKFLNGKVRYLQYNINYLINVSQR